MPGPLSAPEAGEEQRAEQAGEQRCDQDADLGRVLDRLGLERQAGDEQRDGEPDPG
jgi:hypothetical protein